MFPQRPDLGPDAIPAWPGVEWTLGETLAVFLAAFGVARYAEVLFFGVLGIEGSLGLTIVNVLLQVSAPFVVFGWIRLSGRAAPGWLGPAGTRAGDIGTGIAFGFLLLFSSGITITITLAIAKLFVGNDPKLPDVQRGFDGGWIVAFGFLLIVAAPLCEELLFRGFLFRGLRSRWSWWPSAIVTSLLWAIVHGSPYRLLNIFVDGLILAWLYEQRKSLLTTIAAHATLNTILFVVLLNRIY